MASWKTLKDESVSKVTGSDEKILFKIRGNWEEENAKYS